MNGGDVVSRLLLKNHDSNVTKIILAESVAAIESAHNAGILVKDIHYANFLINNDGHIVISDFGFSTKIKDNQDTSYDWSMLYAEIPSLILLQSTENCTEIELQMQEYMFAMTDEQISGKLNLICKKKCMKNFIFKGENF